MALFFLEGRTIDYDLRPASAGGPFAASVGPNRAAEEQLQQLPAVFERAPEGSKAQQPAFGRFPQDSPRSHDRLGLTCSRERVVIRLQSRRPREGSDVRTVLRALSFRTPNSPRSPDFFRRRSIGYPRQTP